MKSNIIQKEEISRLNFSDKEVLNSSEKINERYHLLKRGEALGNAYKHKLKILFQTTEGRWAVYTTIWFATEIHIQLKGGVVIPVKAIEDVVLNSM